MSGTVATRLSPEGPLVLELRDPARGQYARVIPALGANLVEYRVRMGRDEVALIDPPPDLAAVAKEPIRWGCPVLFPFPNRIRDGVYRFGGQEHRLTESMLDGNHIHGLVFRRAWRLVRCDAGSGGVSAELALRSRDHPEIRPQYPFPFEVELRFRLGPPGLTLEFVAHNAGASPMPMGFGLHPYFRAPIDGSTSSAACRVRVPAHARWELDGLLPTGAILPVEGELDLSGGRSLSGLALDDVYTGLDPTSPVIRCELEDRAAGVRTLVEMERVFREVVVYTPPKRSSVCIEPYTCATDAPNLEARGIDAGLVVLEPGAAFRARARIFAEAID